METNTSYINDARWTVRRIFFDEIVGGKNFNGLGSLGFQMIIAAAHIANDEVTTQNSELVAKNHCAEKFSEMKGRVQREFIGEILEGKIGFHEASDNLVNGVFSYYRSLLLEQ